MRKKRKGGKSHSDGYGFLFLHFQGVYKTSSLRNTTLPLPPKYSLNNIFCANIYHSI